MTAMKNRDEVGAASVDYLMYSGYAVLGYLWARMAKVALDKMAAGTEEEAFYNAKVRPRGSTFKRHAAAYPGPCRAMVGWCRLLMEMQAEHFAF